MSFLCPIYNLGDSRHLMLFKKTDNFNLLPDALLDLPDSSMKIMNKYMQKFPLSRSVDLIQELKHNQKATKVISAYRINVLPLSQSTQMVCPPVCQPNKPMLDQRKLLPTFYYKQTILDLIEKNRIVVISGQTGSGKTTQGLFDNLIILLLYLMNIYFSASIPNGKRDWKQSNLPYHMCSTTSLVSHLSGRESFFWKKRSDWQDSRLSD